MKKLLLTTMMMAAISLTACNNSGTSIKVYTRDTSSGTRDGFFTGIGFEEAKADNTVLVNGYVEVASNGDMISALKNDSYGIGYISLSSLEESGVKGLNFEGVEPTEDNVLNGSYKLTRNFNYCKRAEYSVSSTEEIVDAFIAYMSTVEGKATISEYGGILETSSSDKSWTDVKEEFTIDDADNSSITINIGGSTSVKSIVSNLLTEFSAKCGNFQYNYNPTGSGDAYKRTNGSEKDGTNACDLAFASREFKDSEEMDDSLKGKMCIDAIVTAVNNSNSINGINASALVSIYKGEITSWNDIQ
jgi:phosphate transport system substrate-binding protein